MRKRSWLLLILLLAISPSLGQAQDTPEDYYENAQTEYKDGKFNDAWTDFSLYCSLAPKGDYADYAHLFIWLARSQMHHQTEADIDLSEARQKTWNAKENEWPSKIADFFLGQISEADLMAASDIPGVETANEQHCEAWYYAGMKHLLAGDSTTAAHYFHKCLATDVKDFTEYSFAEAQLKTLGD